MLPSQDTLTSLSEEVSVLSKSLTDYLNDHHVTAPTLAEESPGFYPQDTECQVARLQLLSKLQDMITLALGPGEFLTSQIVYVSCHFFRDYAASCIVVAEYLLGHRRALTLSS